MISYWWLIGYAVFAEAVGFFWINRGVKRRARTAGFNAGYKAGALEAIRQANERLDGLGSTLRLTAEMERIQ